MADRSELPAGLLLAVMIHVRSIHGDDRRHLGAPVAFEQRDAELLLEGGRQRLAQLFGADDGVPEGRELLLACMRRTYDWQNVGVLISMLPL